MGAVDDYFATLDDPDRSAFEQVRALALEVAPRADQATSFSKPDWS